MTRHTRPSPGRVLRLQDPGGHSVVLLSVRAAAQTYAVLVAVTAAGQGAGVTIVATDGAAPDRATTRRVLGGAGLRCLLEQYRAIHRGDLAWATRWAYAGRALREELAQRERSGG